MSPCTAGLGFHIILCCVDLYAAVFIPADKDDGADDDGGSKDGESGFAAFPSCHIGISVG